MSELITGKNFLVGVVSLLFLLFTLFYFYLDMGLAQEIQPASFTCLKPDQGYFSQQNIEYNNIYGIGLAYAKHINETASDFDADLDPPVFRKQTSSTTKSNSSVTIPTHNELLMAVESLEPGIGAILEDKEITIDKINGYQEEEFTHTAVAAYVGAGMADVGFGVEAAARQFNLDFIGITSEHYLMICHERSLEKAALIQFLAQIRSPNFHNKVTELAGYSAQHCGVIESLDDNFL